MVEWPSPRCSGKQLNKLNKGNSLSYMSRFLPESLSLASGGATKPDSLPHLAGQGSNYTSLILKVHRLSYIYGCSIAKLFVFSIHMKKSINSMRGFIISYVIKLIPFPA